MSIARRTNRFTAFIAIAWMLSFAQVASAQRLLDRSEVKQLNGVEVDEQLGNSVPLDAVFTNSKGETVEMSTYFDGETPVILVMVYYECPVVCPVVLSQLVASLNELDYVVGEDYRVVVVSFDDTETTSMALGKRTEFIDAYNKADLTLDSKTIAFHTGDVLNIKRLVNSIGFEYNPLKNGDFAHPISLMILSPKGKVTRYMYGFDYPSRELKLSLLDASEGKIAASFGDRLIHFCYQFDPTAGAYSIQAFRVMQVGALLTVILLIIGLTLLFMGDRVRRKLYQGQQARAQASSETGLYQDSHSSNSSLGSLVGEQTGQVS
ncbi:MAG: SCO family protein [Phycisphaerales bacterium]